MSRTCKICNHNKRLEIDRELIQGKSKSDIVRRYNLIYHSLDYHEKHHLSRQLVESYARKGRLVSDELVSQFEDLFTKANDIYQRSIGRNTTNSDSNAIRCLGEMRNILDTLTKVLCLIMEAQSQDHKRKVDEVRIEDLDLSQFSDDELLALTSAGIKLSDEKIAPLPELIPTPPTPIPISPPKHYAKAPSAMIKTDDNSSAEARSAGTHTSPPPEYSPQVQAKEIPSTVRPGQVPLARRKLLRTIR